MSIVNNNLSAHLPEITSGVDIPSFEIKKVPELIGNVIYNAAIKLGVIVKEVEERHVNTFNRWASDPSNYRAGLAKNYLGDRPINSSNISETLRHVAKATVVAREGSGGILFSCNASPTDAERERDALDAAYGDMAQYAEDTHFSKEDFVDWDIVDKVCRELPVGSAIIQCENVDVTLSKEEKKGPNETCENYGGKGTSVFCWGDTDNDGQPNELDDGDEVIYGEDGCPIDKGAPRDYGCPNPHPNFCIKLVPNAETGEGTVINRVCDPDDDDVYSAFNDGTLKDKCPDEYGCNIDDLQYENFADDFKNLNGCPELCDLF